MCAGFRNRVLADSSAVERTRWGATAAVLVAGVVSAFQIGKLPASLPVLREDLQLSLVAAGWVISTISLVGVATGMTSGWIGDRIGHRRTMLLGMVIMALGTLAGAMAWDAASLIASRFVEGIGYIAIITAAPSLLATVSAPKDRSMVMGIWSFYLGFGLAGMVEFVSGRIRTGRATGHQPFDLCRSLSVISKQRAAGECSAIRRLHTRSPAMGSGI